LITTRTIMVMAKRQVVTITDDIDGRAGAQTVSFAYAGRSYEIDLGERNKAKLEKGLEPFIAAARRVGGPGRSATRKGSTTAATPDRQAVRAWAAEHGYEVSGRGRISKSVLEAYKRAH
jgi:hypothetical protein